jgi:RNA polymerase sigma factor (sigma-70 family)
VDQPDDFTLIDRWRSGDADAGRSLFERYFDAIYRFFVTKFETDADELTQATFLACMRAKDQFRKESSFRTYLYTIARHELHHRLRRYQRHDAKIDFEVSSIAELITTPGTKLARRQDQIRLLEALRKLPVAQQTLLELHYWEDMGIAELADVFEAEAATIRTRLHRARKALRDLMADTAPPAAVETLESMDVWVRGARIEK